MDGMPSQGLYAIVDIDSLEPRGFDPLAFADQVLLARPALLQLRAKQLAPRQTLELLRGLAPRCQKAGTLLFANDRPDLALIAGCDGVHVGQDDLAVDEVRRVAPALRVGCSTHDERQLAAALDQAPDYVAFGPVFATRSKQNPDPVVGLDGLARASSACQARGVPLVAIGGIDHQRAADVARLPVMAAVISALLPPDAKLESVAEQARALARALEGGE